MTVAATNALTDISRIIDVPIKLLIPSKRNVRKSTPSKESHDELVAAIRAIGLLHPPIVIDSSGDGLYEVIAGKRRLKALQELVKEGHYSEDDTIPCRRVAGDHSNLEEISLIENTHRAPMHPADEFEAFRKMRSNGATPSDIALHLGISEKTVYQRLKLGQVAPVIIKAFRNDEIKLAAVMAFTLEDDKTRQSEVFEALQAESRFGVSEREVRNALIGDLESSTSRIGKFVGEKAYEKAGGAVSHDLFEEVAYFNDTALLNHLAIEKLQRAADKLEGWNWVEITLERQTYSSAAKTIRPFDTPDTAPLREQLKVIEDARETLERTVDPDDWTDKHAEQAQRLEDNAEKIERAIAASQAYRPQEQQFAGCLVWIDHQGEMEITRGIIRKEDEKKLEEAAGNKSSKKKSAEKNETAAGELDGDNTYSQALIADLTTYRLNIAKHYLALNTEAAQNLLIYTLCSTCLSAYYYSSPMDLSIRATNPEHALAQPDTSRALQAFKERQDALQLDWMELEDEGARFEAFTALPQEAKFDLMAYCVASALKTNPLNAQLNTVAEIVIRGLDIPWHSEFKPDATNYFGRLSKEHLIEHGKLFLDEDWPARAAKRSKKELANDLEAVFAGEDQTMPIAKRAAAIDWVPEAFRTGSIA